MHNILLWVVIVKKKKKKKLPGRQRSYRHARLALILHCLCACCECVCGPELVFSGLYSEVALGCGLKAVTL